MKTQKEHGKYFGMLFHCNAFIQSVSKPKFNNQNSECRGLKFSKTGDLLSRPFHKFFNLHEVPGACFWLMIANYLCRGSSVSNGAVKYGMYFGKI